MAASPLGKRKDAPAADEGGGRPTFASVPDACWQIVGSFAAPPDAYNLSLSSKRFFRPGDAAVGVGSRVLVRDVRSMPELNGRHGVVVRNATKKGKVATKKGKVAGGRISVLVDGMEQPVALKVSCATPPLLATTLLRRSLLSSLGRVLDRSPSGISLEAVLALPEGALIAGSTVAQACLGVLWEGKYDEAPDVDVFTSAKAAPMVRSWLVEHANAMFGGFHDTYIDIADSRLLYTVDTKIHHVEKWGSIFQNIGENLEGMNRYSYGTKTAWSANGEGAEIALEALKNTEYYQSAIKWGKNCKSYADAKWKHTMCFDELGIDQNKAYGIKPRPGGDLPFDFNGDGSIDLIVGRIKTKEDGEKEYVSPFDLLEDFDLTICKASFDGKTFRIPDPHHTFSAQTTMEPNRRAVVESYVRHFKPPSGRYLEPTAESAIASAAIAKVREDVPDAPFYRQVDVAAMLPDVEESVFLGRREVNMWDPVAQAKYGASIQFHNWTRKLVERLRKYQQRGIEVVDAPTIGDDFQIREFHVCQHGG